MNSVRHGSSTTFETGLKIPPKISKYPQKLSENLHVIFLKEKFQQTKAPSTRAIFMWQFLFARVDGSTNICC